MLSRNFPVSLPSWRPTLRLSTLWPSPLHRVRTLSARCSATTVIHLGLATRLLQHIPLRQRPRNSPRIHHGQTASRANLCRLQSEWTLNFNYEVSKCSLYDTTEPTWLWASVPCACWFEPELRVHTDHALVSRHHIPRRGFVTSLSTRQPQQRNKQQPLFERNILTPNR